MIEGILTPIVVLSVIALLGGMILTIASKYMAVPVDERVANVRSVLPGTNCGACGFAGCEAYAEKLVFDGVKSNLCTPGGSSVAQAIAEGMGVAAEEVRIMSAIIQCSGSCDKTDYSIDYQGPKTCESCNLLYQGRGQCSYSCIGFGDCERACNVDAIYFENGIPVVNREKCNGCGMCVRACPKAIIDTFPSYKVFYVACSSKDKGSITRKVCAVGCIGCKKCEKVCRYGALVVKDNLARVSSQGCVNCGECLGVCPTSAIKTFWTPYQLMSKMHLSKMQK